MDRKNILLVCKETYSLPMHFLAKLLREDIVNLAGFFICPHEALFNNADYNFFKSNNKDIVIYDMKQTAQRYMDDVDAKRIKLNNEYLSKIEKDYSFFKNINLQFMTSQFHTPGYHDRNYFYDIPYEQQLYWLQLYYQKVENMLDEFKPDIIYDTDNAELGRFVLLEIANSRGIPYISLEHSRIERYYIPSTTLGLEVFEPFKKEYEFLKTKYAHCKLNNLKGFKYLSNFRKKETILSEDEKTINPLYKKWETLVELYKTTRYSLESLKSFWKTRRIRKGAMPFYVRYFKRIQYHYLSFCRNFMIRKFENTYFTRINFEEEKYVLFPLHMIPESSTFTKAPYFCSETFIIESLAKSVPWDVKIVVKEHYSMFGERPLSFYKKLQKLPNVVLLSPFQDKDPKKCVQNCLGVVTITGTSALEAAFYGKPSIIFGPTSYEVLSCVNKITDLTQIRSIVTNWANGEICTDDHELVAYIEAVFLYGQNLSLETLLQYNTNSNNNDDKKIKEETLKLKEILNLWKIL